MRFGAYRFRDERTVGAYYSRERLGGRVIHTAGLSLWIGAVDVTVRR